MSEVQKLDKVFFEPVKSNYLSVGLSDHDFAREVSFALQHISKQPLLQKCTRESILKSVANLAQVGLTLNPISKYAYLIPRYNKDSKTFECVLEPDYRGLQKLLTDTGAVKSIEAQVIWEGDEINIDMADDRKLIKHKPYWLVGKEKGKILGAYSLAKLPNESFHIEAMSYKDIEDIKNRSESWKAYLLGKIKTCIWLTDEPEMCRKTVIKRHYKYLPKSAGMEQLEKAIELDNVANGFDEPVDFGLVTLVEQMIYQSSLDEKKKKEMTDKMLKLEYKSQAFKMIEELKDSQPVPGFDRPAGPQYEISEAVKRAADKDDFYERKK